MNSFDGSLKDDKFYKFMNILFYLSIVFVFYHVIDLYFNYGAYTEDKVYSIFDYIAYGIFTLLFCKFIKQKYEQFDKLS